MHLKFLAILFPRLFHMVRLKISKRNSYVPMVTGYKQLAKFLNLILTTRMGKKCVANQLQKGFQ